MCGAPGLQGSIRAVVGGGIDHDAGGVLPWPASPSFSSLPGDAEPSASEPYASMGGVGVGGSLGTPRGGPTDAALGTAEGSAGDEYLAALIAAEDVPSAGLAPIEVGWAEGPRRPSVQTLFGTSEAWVGLASDSHLEALGCGFELNLHRHAHRLCHGVS